MTQYTPRRSPITHNRVKYNPGDLLPEMPPSQLQALQAVNAIEAADSSTPEVEVNLESAFTPEENEELRSLRQAELEDKSTDELKAIAKDHGITYQNKKQAIAEILEKEGLSPTL